MKLQPKKQVNDSFNAQRRNQIDEGVRIAKKIDVLRETLVTLEEQHKNFIARSKEELILATKKLTEEKSTIEREIQRLEAKRATLLKPLDEEWAKLNDEKADFNKKKEKQEVKEREITEREEKVKKDETRIEAAKVTLDERDRRTGLLIGETIEANRKAKDLYSKRVREYADHRQTIDRETTEVARDRKENDVQREANARDKEANSIKEKKLKDEERRIKDLYDTLQRTITRVKK